MPVITQKCTHIAGAFFLYKENHAIIAWFEKGSADDYKANKRQAKNVFVRKAPSGRELAPKATEGECVQLSLVPVSSRSQCVSRAPSVFCFAKSTVSLRLGYLAALKHLVSFTTARPLRYLPEGGL